MTTPENGLPKKKFKTWQIILFVLILFMLIGKLFGSGNSNSSSSSTSSNTTTTTQTASVDIMTKSSCEDWHVVIGEGAKGVQTDAELRAGMKKVYETARYSEDADIVDAATRQLAAVTAGDSAAFAIAGNDFGSACKAHGQ